MPSPGNRARILLYIVLTSSYVHEYSKTESLAATVLLHSSGPTSLAPVICTAIRSGIRDGHNSRSAARNFLSVHVQRHNWLLSGAAQYRVWGNSVLARHSTDSCSAAGPDQRLSDAYDAENVWNSDLPRRGVRHGFPGGWHSNSRLIGTPVSLLSST